MSKVVCGRYSQQKRMAARVKKVFCETKPILRFTEAGRNESPEAGSSHRHAIDQPMEGGSTKATKIISMRNHRFSFVFRLTPDQPTPKSNRKSTFKKGGIIHVTALANKVFAKQSQFFPSTAAGPYESPAAGSSHRPDLVPTKARKIISIQNHRFSSFFGSSPIDRFQNQTGTARLKKESSSISQHSRKNNFCETKPILPFTEAGRNESPEAGSSHRHAIDQPMEGGSHQSKKSYLLTKSSIWLLFSAHPQSTDSKIKPEEHVQKWSHHPCHSTREKSFLRNKANLLSAMIGI